ncbi:hypothetical protein Q2941_44025 [Bradyrhizobium sp. UFLA05-153]
MSLHIGRIPWSNSNLLGEFRTWTFFEGHRHEGNLLIAGRFDRAPWRLTSTAILPADFVAAGELFDWQFNVMTRIYGQPPFARSLLHGGKRGLRRTT